MAERAGAAGSMTGVGMSGYAGIAILVIGIIAIVLFINSGRKPRRPQANPISPPPPPRQSKIEDQLAESLAAYKFQISSRENNKNSALKDQITEANQLLTEATQLGRKLGLSEAVVYACSAVEHWHAWMKREDFKRDEYIPDGYVYIGGDRTTVGDKPYTYADVAKGSVYYRFVEKEGFISFDGRSKHAKMSMEQYDGTSFRMLIECDATQNLGRDYDQPWQPFRVTAINVGDWAKDLIEFSEMLKGKFDRRMLEMSAESTLKTTQHLRK